MRRKGPRAPVAAAALWIAAAGCGQKGPPLAPLHLVPAAVTEVSLRRVEDHARLRFVLPTSNANGPGPVELDRVEIFAMTIPPGAPAPANRDLLTKPYLVGEVPVRPVGADAPPGTEGDPRPAPGEPAAFEEVLTSEQLTPVPVKPDTASVKPDAASVKPGAVPAPPSAPAAGTPPGTSPPSPTGAETGAPGQSPGTTEAQPAEAPSPAPVEAPPPPAATAAAGPASAVGAQSPAAAAGGQQPGETAGPVSAAAPGEQPGGAPAVAAPPAPVSKDPVRIYVARGVTRGGRPGAPSARVQLPLGPLPAPPSAPTVDLTESAVVVAWTPPAGEVPPPAFNVYAGDGTTALNPAPVAAATFEHTEARVGEEHCYSVRGVRVEGPVAVEGPPSERACITPADIFPPATPAGLAAVSTPGQISLIWDPNTEPDLAGYLILRGEAPDGPLQPLITSPIRETSYRDTTVRPDVRYVYAIIAVDTANPPNTSAMSERAEETAR